MPEDDASKQTPPAPTQETPPPEPAVDEYDTSADESELEAANAELEQSRDAIDKGFAEHMAANLSPELEELFYKEDKTEFFLAVEKEKEEFIKQIIGPKYAKVNELSMKIADKKQGKALNSAMQEFLKIYPDADFDAMYEFFSNELGKKKQDEIKALPPLEAYKAVYELMNKDNPKAEKLPEQIKGSFSQQDTQGVFDADLPATRY